MFDKLIDRTLTNLNKSNIIVSAERCIRKRYHKVECVRCVEYCPVDCIRLNPPFPPFDKGGKSIIPPSENGSNKLLPPLEKGGKGGFVVEVDFEKCIECGVCVNACPTEVFTHKKLTNGKVMSKLKQYAETLQIPSPLRGEGQGEGDNPLNSPFVKGDRGLFIFACSMAREENEPLPPNSIVFPCLGFLTETHLVGAVSYLLSSSPYFKGRIEEGLIKGGVILDCNLCNECEFEKGIEIIKKTAASANKLLSAFGKGEMIVIADTIQQLKSKILNLKLRTSNPDNGASRREFFSQMKNSTYKMIADSIEDEETVIEELFGNLPAFLPKRREILIKLLKNFGIRDSGFGIRDMELYTPNPELNGFPFIRLSVDDKCNFCDMCSTFCPTGAIEKIKTVDDITITFNISKCVNCYPCYNLCPKNAMSCSDTMEINKIIDDKGETLISRGMTECLRCEMPFLDYEGKGVCRRCEKLSRFEEGYLSKMER